MRLVVEEAKDHSTCMETVRQRHGADCVVVHSFRGEEKYRIVVALETEASRRSVLDWVGHEEEDDAYVDVMKERREKKRKVPAAFIWPKFDEFLSAIVRRP